MKIAKKTRTPISFGDIVLAVAGGVLLSASQQPLQTPFLAFFCLIPLFIALRGKNYRSAFILAYLWGFVSNALSLYWIAIPTFGGMVAAIVILALYNALFGLAYSFFERRSQAIALAVSPILWTAMEFIRGYGRLGFPWLDLGYTMGPYTVIIQIADIFGHLGITFWLVTINALILGFVVARKRRWFVLALLIIVAVLPFPYGIWRLNRPNEVESIRVALLQSNISAYQKWERDFRNQNIEYYVSMMDSLPEKVDLIVLPETATAHYHRVRPEVVDELVSASRRFDTPILTGTLDFEPSNRKIYYNSAMLVTPVGASRCYNKIMLVPMSEQIPFQERFEILMKLDLGGSHFSRGKEFVLFDVSGIKVASPICYESLFPHIVRNFNLAGARCIINITNDGWFGITQGPHQHANFNRFRAVENRFGIGRCAQTGISLIVDRYGRFTRTLPLDTKGAIIGDVQLKKETTFYARMGDWLGAGSLFASPILMLFIGFLLKCF